MAAPGKQSRWGSFLSQAVAGVESRLDHILADVEEAQPRDPAPPAAPSATAATSTSPSAAAQSPQKPASSPALSKAGASNSRSSSRSGVQDRLQARLAQAVAGKAFAAGGNPSRAASSPRSSTDRAGRPSIDQESSADKQPEARRDDATPEPAEIETPEKLLADAAVADPVAAQPPRQKTMTIEGGGEEEEEEEKEEEGTPCLPAQKPSLPRQDAASAKPEDQPDPTQELRELQELRDRQQEEIREYTERIDSLQSKLQYLSKTASETAKRTASAATSGGLEQKLAEKDEKIALLMEEGHKLSSSEHALRSTTRKLRALIGEHEKQLAGLRTERDRAVSDAEALRARLDGSEDVDRRREEVGRATAALRREIDALKRENAKKEDANRRLEQEWKSKMDLAEASHRETMSKTLATERQKQQTLEQTNAALSAEKEAAAERARQDEIEWQDRLERALERGRKTEGELKAELLAVEGKLEAVRAAAEEASSGNGGEAQVKMFRQIETLQSQYASARENWQGIEASLIAKSANLERERDEAQRRESEMRKKARDAAVRLRHAQDELQDVQPSLVSARNELNACREDMARLEASYKSCQASLAAAREEIDRLKQSLSEEDKADDSVSVEAQRRNWVDEVAGATSRGRQSPPASPLLSLPRTLSADLLGLSGLSRPRIVHTPVGSTPGPGTPVLARAPSNAGSGPPLTLFSPFEKTPSESGHSAYPCLAVAERGENGGSPETRPGSPRQVVQDMISVSTVAAGPSVQLVERMSAAIRRLEAEKVTAKEEMARVCRQRDDARTDLVALLKQLEETRASAARVPDLERQVAGLDARYQTTLEMLGEKSELVEELRADVEDVKSMYRELVERTVN